MAASTPNLSHIVDFIQNADPSLNGGGGGGDGAANYTIHSHVLARLKARGELNAVGFHFTNLHTFCERAHFLIDVVEAALAEVRAPPRGKDDKLSQHLRQLGHKMIRQRHLDKAYEYYAQALTVAEMGGVDMALAYANRAGVLIERGFYREALKDIELTMTCAYPTQHLPKLMARKVAAEAMLFNNAPTTVSLPKPNTRRYHHAPIPPIPPHRANAHLPHAFDSIRLVTTPTEGQHIVASRDIQAGDLLLVEPAFVGSPMVAGQMLQHCDYCTQFSYTLEPCPGCRHVMYCDGACRQRAYTAYHAYECTVLARLFQYGLTRFHALVLRFVIMGRDQLASFSDLANIEVVGGAVYPGGFMQFCRLIKNRAFAREAVINNETKLLNAITSATLYYLIKNYTQLFRHFPTIADMAMELIYLALQADEFIAFDVYKDDWLRGRWRFAHALYPVATLFRPSCCAPVVTSMRGNVLLVHAVQPIKAGQEVHLNYVSYLDRGRAFRRLYVRSVFGGEDCVCEACAHNWPMLAQLMRAPSALSSLEGVTSMVADMVINGRGDTARMLEPILMAILKKEQPVQPGFASAVMQRLVAICFALQGNCHVAQL